MIKNKSTCPYALKLRAYALTINPLQRPFGGLRRKDKALAETEAVQADARTTTARPRPRNALSEVERQAIMELCNRPGYAVTWPTASNSRQFAPTDQPENALRLGFASLDRDEIREAQAIAG